MGMNIAIDGPAGAGKSTVAKTAAKVLSFIYVDTGAMYRAIGLYLLRENIDIDDEETVSKALPRIDVTIGYEEDIQKIYLNGEDVSSKIRTQEVGEAASKTSAYGSVRAHLLGLQRKLAAENNVLMDGRDIGTCVLPNADVKIYLTADAKVRAERRTKELREKGLNCDYEGILKEIEERDYRDMHREIAPLKKAEDAILLDTSCLTIDEAVEEILRVVREKES